MTSLNILLLAVALLGFIGCAPATDRSTAKEARATELLNRTFRDSKESWFAVTRLGKQKFHLVQLHNPQTKILSVAVTDTDRMNGVSERFKLVVECAQSREWDGQWTPWQAGTVGQTSLLNLSFPSAAVGYWVIQFEETHGQWHITNTFPIHDLIQDPPLLESLLHRADVSLPPNP